MMEQQNYNFADDTNDFALEQIIPHCPVVLVLDTSHSMWGKALHDLKQSIYAFYATMQQEEFRNSAVDIASVSMGDNLGMLEEFVPFRMSSLPHVSIRPKGDTPMGAALALALQKIEEQKQHYREHNYSFVTPQLILLSDGKRSSDDFHPAAEEIRSACMTGKLICRAIAMGDSPDFGVLSEIAGDSIVYPKYGDLRGAFATVGKQVSETYEAEAEEAIASLPAYEVTTDGQMLDVTPSRQEETEYLLDGSNLLYWDKERNGVSLKVVLAITSELERQGKPYQVYFDASARHILERECPEEATAYEALLRDHPDHFHQAPAGTSADEFLLFLADERKNRLIMTNDQYKDHVGKFACLNEVGRLLPGMVLGDSIYFPHQSLHFSLGKAEKPMY